MGPGWVEARGGAKGWRHFLLLLRWFQLARTDGRGGTRRTALPSEETRKKKRLQQKRQGWDGHIGEQLARSVSPRTTLSFPDGGEKMTPAQFHGLGRAGDAARVRGILAAPPSRCFAARRCPPPFACCSLGPRVGSLLAQARCSFGLQNARLAQPRPPVLGPIKDRGSGICDWQPFGWERWLRRDEKEAVEARIQRPAERLASRKQGPDGAVTLTTFDGCP